MTIRDFIGRGFRFPFAFSTVTGGVEVQDSTSEEEQVDMICQSIRQILGTRVGERVMRRDFGSRLGDLVFEPLDTAIAEEAAYYVREAIEKWEKRVSDLTVSWEIYPREQVLILDIGFVIAGTNVRGNLVYPFYFGADFGRSEHLRSYGR